ncbi:hypothetical protein E2C01_012154 [Portunus trituberculatus]|uniref:Uncharacterized protein n=1 Tax=Portunus trituberculatus TaxID=210409 RepID=A0A5B7DCR5_PORTR|nr:hypothetical protein [Portunus trituberculatus]
MEGQSERKSLASAVDAPSTMVTVPLHIEFHVIILGVLNDKKIENTWGLEDIGFGVTRRWRGEMPGNRWEKRSNGGKERRNGRLGKESRG